MLNQYAAPLALPITLCSQPHEFNVVVHNFPPRSLEAVIKLRNTLLNYADTYPVRMGSCQQAWVLNSCLLCRVDDSSLAAKLCSWTQGASMHMLVHDQQQLACFVERSYGMSASTAAATAVLGKPHRVLLGSLCSACVHALGFCFAQKTCAAAILMTYVIMQAFAIPGVQAAGRP